MSALNLAGGAVVAGIWKIGAVVLAVLLLVVITGPGRALGRLRHGAAGDADRLRAGTYAMREGRAVGAGVRVRQATD